MCSGKKDLLCSWSLSFVTYVGVALWRLTGSVCWPGLVWLDVVKGERGEDSPAFTLTGNHDLFQAQS